MYTVTSLKLGSNCLQKYHYLKTHTLHYPKVMSTRSFKLRRSVFWMSVWKLVMPVQSFMQPGCMFPHRFQTTTPEKESRMGEVLLRKIHPLDVANSLPTTTSLANYNSLISDSDLVTSSAFHEPRQLDLSYYFLGPKLWYVPLFFSIYFLCYIIALILKAVSRHKIQIPGKVSAAVTAREGGVTVRDQLTHDVTQALAQASAKYIKTRVLNQFKQP